MATTRVSSRGREGTLGLGGFGETRRPALGVVCEPTNATRDPASSGFLPQPFQPEVGASGGLDHRGIGSVDVPKVPPRSACTELARILDSPEIADLIRELEDTRWTGRPGYPVRTMIGMALAKSIYAIPTWTRTVRLVREHDGLIAALGGHIPSEWACYRFASKLRAHSDLLDSCIARVLARLSAAMPEMGKDVCVDASDLPAYANGQRYKSKGGRERAPDEYSDPDARWGAPPCPPARAEGSTATGSTLPPARGPGFPSHGRLRRPAPMSPASRFR